MTLKHIVRLDDFEGPLDLLIELINRKEMDIHNLSITQITDDYLKTLDEMSEQNIRITSDFTEMACLLLRIKSRLLLPEDADPGTDPKEELMQQLLDYKESVEKMKELQQIEQKYFKRTIKTVIKKEKQASMDDILKNFEEIMRKNRSFNEMDRLEKLTHELSKRGYSTEEKIVHLTKRLKEGKKTFEELFSETMSREETIVTFGAVLEMIKSQVAHMEFEDSELFLSLKEAIHFE